MGYRIRVGMAAALVVSAALVSGCGEGDSPASPDASTSAAAPTPSPSPTPTGEPGDLPGEPFDTGPQAGDVLGVVGVAHDEVLEVRVLPGAGQEVVATLEPTAEDVVSQGRARLVDGRIWGEVAADETVGWVPTLSLVWVGETTDETSAVVDRLGRRPEADTMTVLGRLVAREYVYVDADIRSDVVLSVAPTAGDLGEVTYDVIGLGDDSVLGVRLHVFGTPIEDGTGFSLASVEMTTLCARGANPDGLCV